MTARRATGGGEVMQPWRTLESEVVLDHPVLRVDKVLRRKGQEPPHRFVVLSSPDWVNVIPVTPEGQVVLIRQWRHGTGETTLEIPGGLIDPGESPQQAAARELREETGYAAERLVPLGSVRPNPALFDNTCYTFLAPDARLAGATDLDATEDIEVVTVELTRLADMVRSGEIDHCIVVAALTFLWLRAPELAAEGAFMPFSGRDL